MLDVINLCNTIFDAAVYANPGDELKLARSRYSP